MEYSIIFHDLQPTKTSVTSTVPPVANKLCLVRDRNQIQFSNLKYLTSYTSKHVENVCVIQLPLNIIYLKCEYEQLFKEGDGQRDMPL